jgi:hypothetical protein
MGSGSGLQRVLESHVVLLPCFYIVQRVQSLLPADAACIAEGASGCGVHCFQFQSLLPADAARIAEGMLFSSDEQISPPI